MNKMISRFEKPTPATFYNGTCPPIAVDIVGSVLIEWKNHFILKYLVKDNQNTEFEASQDDIVHNF